MLERYYAIWWNSCRGGKFEPLITEALCKIWKEFSGLEKSLTASMLAILPISCIVAYAYELNRSFFPLLIALFVAEVVLSLVITFATNRGFFLRTFSIPSDMRVARIAAFTEALRVVGVVNSKQVEIIRSEAIHELNEKRNGKRAFTARAFELLIMGLLFAFLTFTINMLDNGLELNVAGILICLVVFLLTITAALSGPLWTVYDRVWNFMPLEHLCAFKDDLAAACVYLEAQQAGVDLPVEPPSEPASAVFPFPSETLTEVAPCAAWEAGALPYQRGDYMDVLTYQTWRTTCDALHMLTQMMGKVKLETLDPQPEWQQVVLETAPDGFTTGLIETPDGGFEILLSFEDLRMEASAVSGERLSFSLEDGMSISDCYAQFQEMLQAIGHPCEINPVPQEMFTSTPFPELTDPIEFDTQSARHSFKQFLFARDALSEFAAPFRGKKIPPSLFWGTFDMTTALFSGKPCPYQGEGGIIERVAFDEQFVEFGYWPGDINMDEPAFFALAYPFPDSGSSDDIGLAEAYYDPAASEYFLRLEDVLGYENPKAAVLTFCRDAFQAVAKRQGWEHVDWLTAPLLNDKC